MHSSQRSLKTPQGKTRSITFNPDSPSAFPPVKDNHQQYSNTLSTTLEPSDVSSPLRPFTAKKSSFLTKDSLLNMRRSLLNDSREVKKTGLKVVQLEPAANEVVYEDLQKEEAEAAKAMNKDYEEYKKNFHRLVLDSEKNLLYIKPNEIKVGKTEVIGNEEMTTERLLISLEGKYKSLNPEKVVNQLLKETMKPQKPQYHIKGKKYVEEVKSQAKNILDSQIKAMKYEKIVNETKSQIDKMSLASIEALEKVSLEK